jgi:RNA polymerase sigma-70 factor (sigma-E family)
MPQPGPEFDAFVRSASPALLRTAFRLTGDRGHAEDLLQLTLIRTATHWPSAQEAPYSYARKVLVNLAKDRVRRLGRRVREAVLPDRLTAGAVGGPETAIVERDRLMRALRSLPISQQAVIVLRIWEDLSVADTADALGCSEGHVKSAVHRALRQLRTAMSEMPLEEDSCSPTTT